MTLERYRYSENHEETDFYKQLIKDGTCFIVYKYKNRYIYGPSKFLGYFGNSIDIHKRDRGSRDGRITNPIIETILKDSFTINNNHEIQYIDFCIQNNIKPNKTGKYGKPRKFLYNTTVSDIQQENILENDIGNIITKSTINVTEKKQEILSRIGQGDFRNRLLKYWKGCSVTRLSNYEILKASHIKPWSLSTDVERLDVFNGLLLIPNLDCLFDKGLISFDNNGYIIISTLLSPDDISILGLNSNMSFTIKEEHKKYLEFHRKNIFIDQISTAPNNV